MQITAGVLFCLLPFCLPVQIHQTGQSVIDDYQQAISSIPREWSAEPVIILSDSTCMEFTPLENEAQLTHVEDVIYYVNKQNPVVIGTIPVFDNAVIENIPEVHVRVLYPDGTEWENAGGTSERVPVHTGMETATNRYGRKVNIPKYLKGMVVHKRIRRTYVRPEFFPFETFERTLPVLRRGIELVVPDSSAIVKKFFNGGNLPVTVTDTLVNGKRHCGYHAKQLEKQENPDSYYEAERVCAALYVSFPPEGSVSYSWEQLGEYYLSLIENSYIGMDTLKHFAASLNSGSCDSLVAGAVHLVRKKMRYHDYSEGLYAFVPHELPSILSKGYGDCKDLSIVCQSIGKLNGCSIGLFLLHAAEGFQPAASVPSLGVFNHVVLFFQSSAGERLVVDPTIPFGKPLETGFYHIGKSGMYLDRGSCLFDTVAVPSAFYNTISTHSRIIHNTATKAWELDGKITLCGMTSMNLYMANVPTERKKQLPFLKRYLKRFFELDVTVATITKMTPDTIAIKYTALFEDNFLSLGRGGFRLNKPSLYGGHVRFTTLSYTGPRYFDEMRQKDIWEVPPGYTILEKNNLKGDIAVGKWTRQKREVRRIYSQHRCRIENDEASMAVNAKDSFVKAQLWKK